MSYQSSKFWTFTGQRCKKKVTPTRHNINFIEMVFLMCLYVSPTPVLLGSHRSEKNKHQHTAKWNSWPKLQWTTDELCGLYTRNKFICMKLLTIYSWLTLSLKCDFIYLWRRYRLFKHTMFMEIHIYYNLGTTKTKFYCALSCNSDIII